MSQGLASASNNVDAIDAASWRGHSHDILGERLDAEVDTICVEDNSRRSDQTSELSAFCTDSEPPLRGKIRWERSSEDTITILRVSR